MKKYYVYKLVNRKGEIEWIGETTQPKIRFWNHKGKNGNFTNRDDLEMVIIEVFEDKKKAYDYQIDLQIRHGLITDNQKCALPGEKNPSAKLTNEQVKEIRRIYEKGKGEEIGRRYGVSRKAIGKVINRQSFKDIDDN